MSLENIQLPPALLRELFRKSLVSLESEQQEIGHLPFSFLGKNQSAIAIVLYDPENVYLAENDLEFLTGILKACKLTLADVAIINFSRTGIKNYQELDQEVKPGCIISFGVSGATLDLPFHVPDFQVQSFDQKKYLLSPSLSDLQANKDLKTKLWEALKILFDLK